MILIMSDLADWAKVIDSTPEEIKKLHERQELLSRRDKLQEAYFLIAFRYDPKLTVKDLLDLIEKEVQDINSKL
jgi:hypothetical protein